MNQNDLQQLLKLLGQQSITNAAMGMLGRWRRKSSAKGSEYAKMLESRRQLQERLDRGEQIPRDEIAGLPSSYLPEELVRIRSHQRVERIMEESIGGSTALPLRASESSPGSAQPENATEPPKSQGHSRIEEIIRQTFADYDSNQNAAAVPPQQEKPDINAVVAGSVLKQDSISGGGVPVPQPAAPGVLPSKPPAPEQQGENQPDQPSRTSTAMDSLQLGLDVAGIFDPTPMSDGTNAAISIGRMFTDPDRAMEHAGNAAISAVSMIPYVGDFAKLLKARRASKTVQRGAQMIRGGENAKSLTAAEKKAERTRLREQARSTNAVVQGDPSQDESESSSPDMQPGQTGSSLGSPSRRPADVTPVMDPGTGLQQSPMDRRDEQEGSEEVEKWTQKLKDGGEKLLGFFGVVGKGATTVTAFVNGLSLLNTGVLALNRDLVEYNGKIATAYGLAEAASIERKYRKGEALAQPLSQLSGEQSKLADSLATLTNPLQEIGINALTQITVATNKVIELTGVIEVMAATLEGIAKFLVVYVPPDTSEPAWTQFLQDVSDGRFDGKRPDFMGRSHIQLMNDHDHKDVFGS